MSAAKILGYLVVSGAVVVKVPQILQIKRHGAAGLSLHSQLLDLFGLSLSLCYHVANKSPFSAFGEDVFNTAGTLVVLGQITGAGAVRRNTAPIVAYLLICGSLASVRKVLSRASASFVLLLVQTAITAVFVVAKVPQICSNFINKGVGELNLVTNLLFLAGNAARVFTTSKLPQPENRGALVGALVGAALNAVVVAQIVVYGKGDQKPTHPRLGRTGLKGRRDAGPGVNNEMVREYSYCSLVAMMPPPLPYVGHQPDAYGGACPPVGRPAAGVPALPLRPALREPSTRTFVSRRHSGSLWCLLSRTSRS